MAIISDPNNTGKKKKIKTTIDPAAAAAAVSLPEELIWEVLLRLPAKSLARLRCVCRSWNHHLWSDAFQRLYSDTQQAAAASVGRLAFAAARLAPPHPWEVCEGLTIMPCDGCPRFVGGKPCHRGVALLSRPCTGEYALCNVSTGGLLRLPPCPVVGYISAAGVGYHAATDEYKVVRLALMPDRPVWSSLVSHVLTVGAGATAANGGSGIRGGWRALAVAVGGGAGRLSNSNNILIEPLDPVFANGCLHWTLVTGMLLRHDDGNKPAPEGILSFSLATESFATVPPPPFVISDLVPYDDDHPHASRLRTATTLDDHRRVVMQPIGTALAELDGWLCMIRDLRRRDDRTMFEVWKLKDYESGVWSLDYRIHKDLLPATSSSSLTTKKLVEPWLVIPICYLPSDDGDDGDDRTKRKILLATTAHEVHLYDPKTATLETIASATRCCNYPDPTNQDNDLYLVMHQESLLHIDGMEYGAKGITESINVCSVDRC